MAVLVGCYPGSFNPPTIAHLAVAEAARRHAGLDRVDLVLSVAALGKSSTDGPPVDQRRSVLQAVARSRPWLGGVVTDARLIADIAAGYDAVALRARKVAHVLDPARYVLPLSARADALPRLPRVLVAPRSGDHPDGVELLDVPTALHTVSASAVRAGHPDAASWALPEAAASGLWPR